MEKINNFDEKLCICGHTESEAHIFIGQPEADSQCIGNGGNCECKEFIEYSELYESALSLTERQRNAFRDELLNLGYKDDDLRRLVAELETPDLKHDWTAGFGGDMNAWYCKKCKTWTGNLPKYKNDVCALKDRRKNDRRQNG